MSYQPHNFTGKLAQVFVDSKLTVIFVLAALLFGVLAILQTPREENPQITMPDAVVIVAMPGASPSEVEEKLLRPLEYLVNQIPNVDYFEGTAMDSAATVNVRFNVGEDKERALNRVYDRIYSGLHLLPKEAQPPQIRSIDADDVPILNVTLSSKTLDDYALQRLGERMLDEIQSLEPVAYASVLGGRSRELIVEIRPQRLQAFGVTLEAVQKAVAAGGVSAPMGEVTERGHLTRIRIDNGWKTAEQLRKLVVGVVPGNRTVRLEDVATITDGPNLQRTGLSRFAFGRSDARFAVTGDPDMNAVTLAIAKKKAANAVAVVNDINARIERMKATFIPQDVNVVVTRDDGAKANDAVNTLIEHLGISLVAVIAVTLVILGWRSAAIVAVTVPIILAVTLTVTYLDGLTINRLLLYGLIIALGLLVDDAIVVTENIDRHYSLDPKGNRSEIAVRAAAEIGSPTMLATFTIMIVFAALIPSLTGMPKQYFYPIGFSVPVAICTSLLVAYSVVPWAAKRWLAVPKVSTAGKDAADTGYGRFYMKVANPLIGKPKREAIFFGTIAVLVCISLAMPAWQFIRPSGPAGEPPVLGVQLSFLPRDNKNTFNVTVKLPENSPLERTDRAVRDVAALVRAIPEVTNYQSWVGSMGVEDFNSLLRGDNLVGPHVGAVRVNVTDKNSGRRSTVLITQELRRTIRQELLPRYPGATVQVVEDPAGPPLTASILAEIYGDNLDELRSVTLAVRQEFARSFDMAETRTSEQSPVKEYRLVVNQDKAALSGVVPAQAAQLVRTLVSGSIAGYARTEGERNAEPVRLQIPYDSQFDPRLLSGITIRNALGKDIPLSTLVSVQEVESERPILHKYGVRVATVGGEVGVTSSVYAVLDLNRRLQQMALPLGGHLATDNITVNDMRPDITQNRMVALWQGEMRMMIDSYRDLGYCLIFAVAGIYLTLVAYYRSFLLPWIALTPIPLGFIGIFPGHLLFGTQYSASSMIGLIALAGIVVRNSLLLIDFVQDYLKAGLPLTKAVKEAGAVRLRPILITSLSIVFGSFMLLFDPVFQGLAIVLIFGVATSTSFTLFLVPILLYFYYKHFPYKAAESTFSTKEAAA